ncbi:MAG: phosphodiester glycosidase family protein [Muribaculaceae bacterium]|nr:phosphodiester glycosidase family protein [Muribaculaceae bacterium]
MVFFACAVDEILYVNGFTLTDLCYIFQDFGCTEAINLDCGGSTVNMINGKHIFAPSIGTQFSRELCNFGIID